MQRLGRLKRKETYFYVKKMNLLDTAQHKIYYNLSLIVTLLMLIMLIETHFDKMYAFM